jgi:hypothetical protein
VENPVYHVLHEGRRIGPYDRRTIVGMKVKKTLSSRSVLVGADGVETTVGELLRQGQPDSGFAPSGDSRPEGAGSYSVVQGIHNANLLEVEGRGYAIPPFKGEVEVRVQTKVLRLSGRYREVLGWKEDRVKFPLQDIAHARLRGTVVDLWVRTTEPPGLQRISLDLLKREAAGELAESLSFAAPWPGSEPLAGKAQGGAAGVNPLLLAAAFSAVVVVGLVLLWAFTRH